MALPIFAETSAADARALGRSRRKVAPRSAMARFGPVDRDPVSILEEQHATRLQGLVPVRIGRMLQSPFAYYRGTAAVMAHDLAGEAVSGHEVMICGDAHISNFGLFASPERRVLFDLNDFDEAAFGPWEWDVKRTAASVFIGAKDNGSSDQVAADATRDSVRSYRTTMHDLCRQSALERYFFQVETDWLERTLSSDTQKVMRRTARKASNRTSARVLEKVVIADDDGTPRIQDQPPIMVHVDHADPEEMQRLWFQYLSTLRADTAVLLSQFVLTDWALRVVGVGSVGTRCYVLFFQGPCGEPLFLQAKEAPPSVVQTYGGLPSRLPACVPPATHGVEGHRVVSGQRILQAQSDPFLGWVDGFAGENAERRPVDYYWRQFRDMKGSVELGALSESQFSTYGELCGTLLARAHSQSPGCAAIDGYLGDSDRFDDAIATWSKSYSDQIERDFEAVERAVTQGRLPISRDI